MQALACSVFGCARLLCLPAVLSAPVQPGQRIIWRHMLHTRAAREGAKHMEARRHLDHSPHRIALGVGLGVASACMCHTHTDALLPLLASHEAASCKPSALQRSCHTCVLWHMSLPTCKHRRSSSVWHVSTWVAAWSNSHFGAELGSKRAYCPSTAVRTVIEAALQLVHSRSPREKRWQCMYSGTTLKADAGTAAVHYDASAHLKSLHGTAVCIAILHVGCARSILELNEAHGITPCHSKALGGAAHAWRPRNCRHAFACVNKACGRLEVLARATRAPAQCNHAQVAVKCGLHNEWTAMPAPGTQRECTWHAPGDAGCPCRTVHDDMHQRQDASARWRVRSQWMPDCGDPGSIAPVPRQ